VRHYRKTYAYIVGTFFVTKFYATELIIFTRPRAPPVEKHCSRILSKSLINRSQRDEVTTCWQHGVSVWLRSSVKRYEHVYCRSLKFELLVALQA
jgi:hypothetical protein